VRHEGAGWDSCPLPRRPCDRIVCVVRRWAQSGAGAPSARLFALNPSQTQSRAEQLSGAVGFGFGRQRNRIRSGIGVGFGQGNGVEYGSDSSDRSRRGVALAPSDSGSDSGAALRSRPPIPAPIPTPAGSGRHPTAAKRFVSSAAQAWLHRNSSALHRHLAPLHAALRARYGVAPSPIPSCGPKFFLRHSILLDGHVNASRQNRDPLRNAVHCAAHRTA
jgi:hypothetical protein